MLHEKKPALWRRVLVAILKRIVPKNVDKWFGGG